MFEEDRFQNLVQALEAYHPVPLQWSLPILAIVASVLFMLGRGLGDWTRVDYVRLAIPPVAFVVWTGLIGTSALTPWTRGLDQVWVTVGAIAVGILLVAVSSLVAPPKTS